MLLKHHARDGRVLIKYGLVFMVLANIGGYFLRRGNAFPESISDPVSGFLFGLSFGCLGLGIWMLGRQRRA